MALTKTDLEVDSCVHGSVDFILKNLKPMYLHCHFLKRKFREIGTAAIQVSIRSSVDYRPN